VAIASIVMFGLFVEPFLNNKNPNAVYSTFYQKLNNITINNDFPLAICLLQSNGKSIPDGEKIYKVKVS
jgi:hypothetical protein